MLGHQFKSAHGTKTADIANCHAAPLGLDGFQARHDFFALRFSLLH